MRFARTFLVLLTLAGASPALAQQVGVNTAVNPDATGTPPGQAARKLVLGQDVIFNEHVVTGPVGQTQMLFLDESALTVGPESDLTIDRFVYDPKTETGQMAMSASRGVLRFVGGKISKLENAVTMNTPSASIGIRGGVFLANVSAAGQVEVIFLYGKGLTVSANNVTQTITRPGFQVTVAGRGATPSAPAPAPKEAVAGVLAALSGRSGATGGSKNPPTDASVLASGVSNTISGDVAASVQQALQNTPVQTQPPNVNIGTLQTNLQVNTTAPQAAPQVIQADQSAQVAITTTGAFKDAFVTTVNGIPTGFTQSATSLSPFGGNIRNGVLSATSGPTFSFTLGPLTPGKTTNVSAPSNAGTVANGTAFTSPDGNFFYANTTDIFGDLVFFFGGSPVSPTFLAAQPTQQFYAFNLQPDFALASGGSTQTIPFLSPGAGGDMANAVVSPLYLVTQPNQSFGNFNALNNPNGGSPRLLQASLAINGQGASQNSSFVVLTGGFNTSNAGSIYAGGPIRGTVQFSSGLGLNIGSGFATVADGNGNALFGGSTLDGFVLDQNQYNNGNFTSSSATISPFNRGAFTAGGNISYGFNQPATATPLPTGVGTMRTAMNETGFFGGMMQTANGGGLSYAILGATAVDTSPSNSRVAAAFAGVDPFTASQSGLQSLVLQFGTPATLPAGQIGGSRAAFIDNNIYGATENYNTSSQITADVQGTVRTVNEPTPANPLCCNGGGFTIYPRLEMVTSATVPNAINGILPSGVTPCACQYLQWGYWSGQIQTPNAAGTGVGRQDIAGINTWLAGMPTVNMPSSGTASYNGAALGTVFNNGVTYLAAGGFNQSYNFGSRVGSINLTNFDGANYSGTISGSGSSFAGSLGATGVARNGIVTGGFFGPNAAETGGSFAIRSNTGTSYLASGVFAGR